jgi:hypothetical protein
MRLSQEELSFNCPCLFEYEFHKVPNSEHLGSIGPTRYGEEKAHRNYLVLPTLAMDKSSYQLLVVISSLCFQVLYILAELAYGEKGYPLV